jgi:hypothetical protein
LPAQIAREEVYPSGRTRPVHARYQTSANRILANDEDKRYSEARFLGRVCGRIAGGDNRRERSAPQIGGKRRQLTVVALCPAIIDGDTATLDIAHFFEPAAKGIHVNRGFLGRARAKEADQRRRRLLLCARSKRPRCRNSRNSSNEISPSHCSLQVLRRKAITAAICNVGTWFQGQFALKFSDCPRRRWVNRDRCERTASPAMSAMPPKAEVICICRRANESTP